MNSIIKKSLAYAAYYILWVFSKFIIAVFYRPIIKGRENIPQKGTFIFACNHEDNSDILFLGDLTRRRLYFLAHSGLFRAPTRSRFFMKLTDQIQTVKGESTMVVDKAVNLLKDGKLVAVFPEGTIEGGREIIKGHTGVARIAIQSGCQVIPVAVVNSYGIWPKRSRVPLRIANVNVNIGKPMNFNEFKGKHENKKVTRAATNKIMNEIKRLYKEA